MTPTVYLISGANRGIGLGLVKALLARDNVVIFAGTRNPSTSSDLQALASQHPEKLHIVKLISADKQNNDEAVAQVKGTAGRLDVLIANAGIWTDFSTGASIPAEVMSTHFSVNALGPLVLFQSAWPLLQASTDSPKFVAVSSAGGTVSNGALFPINSMSYGTSKAALHFITRKLWAENKKLIAFSICPGGVDTNMSVWTRSQDEGLKNYNFGTVEDSVKGILREVDNATRESHGSSLARADVDEGSWSW